MEEQVMCKNLYGEIYAKLEEITGSSFVKKDEPMDVHTTFRAGGKASVFVEVLNDKQLKETIKIVKEYDVPFFVLGNGSNVLVRDEGYKGVIVKLADGFCETVTNDNNADSGAVDDAGNADGCVAVADDIGGGASDGVTAATDGDKNVENKKISEQNNNMIICAYGQEKLGAVAREASRRGYTGMEALAGIPGTIGGAVAMNAGAYGSEIKDVIESAVVMDKNGDIMILSKDELDLSYRHSRVQTDGLIVLKAVFKLQRGEQSLIDEKLKSCQEARKQKQPLEYPSAGSTFKRPEGYFAGKLIQDAGLKGYQVGGAQVSEKHCGFVINKNHATASDIVQVINDVRDKVLEQFGVMLEPEVKIL